MALQSWTIEEVKSGDIKQWHGLRANIPSGWHECDGTNGTPDLREKYLKGAAAGQEADITGGALTHAHADHASQTHSGGAVGSIAATATAAVKIGTAGATGAANTHTHPAPSFTQPTAHPALSHDFVNHEPPNKTVIWIMKL